MSMAQRIQQFEKRTPERYHLRSRRSQERGGSRSVSGLQREHPLQLHNLSHDPSSGPSPVKGNHSKLTQPQTPHLMTKKRSRPPTVKSSAELEAEEVEKLQK